MGFANFHIEITLTCLKRPGGSGLPPDVRKGFAFPLNHFRRVRGSASDLIEGRSPKQESGPLPEGLSPSAHQAAKPQYN